MRSLLFFSLSSTSQTGQDGWLPARVTWWWCLTSPARQSTPLSQEFIRYRSQVWCDKAHVITSISGVCMILLVRHFQCSNRVTDELSAYFFYLPPPPGICSLSLFHRQFISTCLDGTVQMFEMPHPARSHVSHVTPKLVTIGTLQEGDSQSIHGIAMSKNCLLAAVVLE